MFGWLKNRLRRKRRGPTETPVGYRCTLNVVSYYRKKIYGENPGFYPEESMTSIPIYKDDVQ